MYKEAECSLHQKPSSDIAQFQNAWFDNLNIVLSNVIYGMGN